MALLLIGILFIVAWAVLLAAKVAFALIHVLLVIGLILMVAAAFQSRASPTRRA